MRDPGLARPVLARMLGGDVLCIPGPRVEGPESATPADIHTMADILA